MLFKRLFAKSKRNCGHRMANYKCRVCGTDFCKNCLDKHAEKIAEISSNQLGKLPHFKGYKQVIGTVHTFGREDKAWCPKCVNNVQQMAAIRRTVS